MKINEIAIGSDYAIEIYKGAYVRGRVLEVGSHTRTVSSGARWDFGGHSATSKMVAYRSIKADGTTADQIEWVMPAKVHLDWAAYAEHDILLNQKKEALNAELEKIEKAAADRGIRISFRRTSYEMYREGTATINYRDVAKLLGLE